MNVVVCARLVDGLEAVADGSNESDRPGEALAVECDNTDWDMVEDVVSEALQIHGANGYQREHRVEYLYRLARGRQLPPEPTRSRRTPSRAS